MENPVIIFGATAIGKVAYDIFTSNRVQVYCFLDEDASKHGTDLGEVTVLGSPDDDAYLKLVGKKCEAFVASDDNKYRQTLVEKIVEDRKVMPINAIHEKAYLSPSAHIGHGNLINSGASINAAAKISNHCIIHSNAVIEVEAELADFVQIGAGCIVNSQVKIEKGAFIGSGAVIVSGVTIGKNARVGAGSVVISNVAPKETVFGNPALAVKK